MSTRQPTKPLASHTISDIQAAVFRTLSLSDPSTNWTYASAQNRVLGRDVAGLQMSGKYIYDFLVRKDVLSSVPAEIDLPDEVLRMDDLRMIVVKQFKFLPMTAPVVANSILRILDWERKRSEGELPAYSA